MPDLLWSFTDLIYFIALLTVLVGGLSGGYLIGYDTGSRDEIRKQGQKRKD